MAKEKCDDQAGNAKEVCLKEAKATEAAAKADAKKRELRENQRSENQERTKQWSGRMRPRDICHSYSRQAGVFFDHLL